MGKSEFICYNCDTCPNVFDSPSELKSITVAARHYDRDGKRFVPVIEAVDVCQSCFRRFFDLVDSQFATIEKGVGPRKIISHFGDQDGKENDVDEEAT